MAEAELMSAWRRAVATLRRQPRGAAFELYIDDVVPLAAREGRVTLGVPSELVRDLMRERYAAELDAALGETLGRAVRVEFELATDQPKPVAPTPAPAPDAPTDDFAPLPLNERFTFETFIPGNNRFPHAAAEAVAKSLATNYNPLFIYGGVGLGKTHLMHAIGQRVRQANPAANIVYLSAETFLSHFVTSLRTDRMADFRRRYRSVDLWLVDDIQLIASRDSTRTEAEFFHTFNALHETNKQIVITSDRPPKELAFDDRLRSRFEWGLITDIKPPDLETRLAILQRRVSVDHLSLDPEVLQYIAQVVRDNIRVLEGALNKVVATAELMELEPDLELARECLQGYSIGERGPSLSPRTILETTARFFGLAPELLRDKSRRQEIVRARQVAMFLCHEVLGTPFAEIGRHFERDHTTVMHGCAKIGDALGGGDDELAADVDALRRNLAAASER